jgi:hypothetical protein
LAPMPRPLLCFPGEERASYCHLRRGPGLILFPGSNLPWSEIVFWFFF